MPTGSHSFISGDESSPIPVVDIGRADAGGEGLAEVAGAVDEACREVGFLVVTGHGVDHGVIDEAWRAAREFFDLPLEEKLKVPAPSPEHAYGYSPLAAETLARSLGNATLPDLKESLSIGPQKLPPVIPDDARGLLTETDWPENPPELRAAWETYFEAMAELAARLLRIMAVGLGLGADYFEPMIAYHSSAMRAINYPHLDSTPPSGQLRAGAHTDYGTLSILTYDDAPGGLEVELDNRWAAIPQVPGGFVVNLGDMMARWTNDRWVSTMHRVGIPPPDAEGSTRRQSIVFFHNASWDAEVRCIPTCLGESEKPKYPPVLAGPHLLSKFSSTVGEY